MRQTSIAYLASLVSSHWHASKVWAWFIYLRVVEGKAGSSLWYFFCSCDPIKPFSPPICFALQIVKTIEHRMGRYTQVVLDTCAHAGTGNVLKVQEMLHLCAEHLDEKAEHQVRASPKCATRREAVPCGREERHHEMRGEERRGVTIR